ncbi:MAG: hypothetical protein WBM62_21460, partial [Crocosphaera sp.]
QGIGFDTDDSISANTTFQLYGTQTWGIQDFDNYQYVGDGWQTYSITVGDYFTGGFNSLVFANDYDANGGVGSSSQFRNIRIFESTNNSLSENNIPENNDDTILEQIYQETGIDLTDDNSDPLIRTQLGTTEADTFLLGDETQAYYNEDGYKDFVLIKDFNTQEGDTLQLHGDAGLYDVVSLDDMGYNGSAIFYQEGNTDDLMAIVTGDAVNLDTNAVSFV